MFVFPVLLLTFQGRLALSPGREYGQQVAGGKVPLLDQGMRWGKPQAACLAWPQACRTEGRALPWMPRQHVFTEAS